VSRLTYVDSSRIVLWTERCPSKSNTTGVRPRILGACVVYHKDAMIKRHLRPWKSVVLMVARTITSVLVQAEIV
jgi:hypothetical protein